MVIWGSDLIYCSLDLSNIVMHIDQSALTNVNVFFNAIVQTGVGLGGGRIWGWTIEQFLLVDEWRAIGASPRVYGE